MDESSTLQKEYCPPIDIALFYAIISDYDLTNVASLEAARSILDEIRLGAELEESSGFDPSGSSNDRDNSSANQESGHDHPWNGEDRPLSDETDLTSLTASTQSLGLNNVDLDNVNFLPVELDHGIESISIDEKFVILVDQFPSIKPFDIDYVLTKCNFNIEKAINELLTQTLLQEGHNDISDEYQVIPKSIDGFTGTDGRKTKRKGKMKTPGRRDESSYSSPASPSTYSFNTPNKWNVARDDVEFLVQRTGLAIKTVTSAYHKSNGSLRETILYLGSRASNPAEAEAIIHAHAFELSQEFPTITLDHAQSIVKLSHPSTASAHDLAKGFIRPVYTGQGDSGPIVPQYTRIAIDEDGPDRAANPSHRLSNRDTFGAGSLGHLNAQSTTASSLNPSDEFTTIRRNHNAQRIAPAHGAGHNKDYAAARDTARAQANAAYKKSKSQPLMAGAAAYYASASRDASAAAQAQSYESTRALVSRQSSKRQIDLHGVDARNAILIAHERVRHWWDSCVPEWEREGKPLGDGGFRIVTGMGKHSQGGRPILGPAIRKTLDVDGWKIEEESGVIVVKGVKGRRCC